MKKVKTNMPSDKKKKCQIIIHGAAAAAATAAAVPIPVADAIPITVIQVAMIINLGKAFDITINESVAEAIIKCEIAQQVGRTLSANILKVIPIVNIVSIPINVAIASSLTEVLGWMVADDFYKISIEEEPNNIFSKVPEFSKLFKEGKNILQLKNRKSIKKITTKKNK